MAQRQPATGTLHPAGQLDEPAEGIAPEVRHPREVDHEAVPGEVVGERQESVLEQGRGPCPENALVEEGRHGHGAVAAEVDRGEFGVGGRHDERDRRGKR